MAVFAREHGRAGHPRECRGALPRRRCAGVADPERKRKIIGRLFIEVFDEEAHKLEGVRVAGAGHDLPGRDRVGRREDRQGARHQVAPQRGRPARAHEAQAGRAAARAVQGRGAAHRPRARPAARDGVSPSVPGPGARRAHPRRGDASSTPTCCARPTTSSSTSCARTASYDKTSQAFAVFLPVSSVGVMGDGRRYDYVIALRAVETVDFMTARWAHLPYELLDVCSRRIVNEVQGHLARRLRHLRQAAGHDRVGVVVPRVRREAGAPRRTATVAFTERYAARCRRPRRVRRKSPSSTCTTHRLDRPRAR